ncbi:hypothetical protein SCLCIDRAFT_866873 [Scleroderma citrinum Foug A]|uniref:Secreted protein n=1 Tax=Scleroderma citrinum Foug A TaxID=1036808 RepID=A0A0C3E0W8_9AGAM|nr:hypothetical protein SCLCIDRAFT_866873 [Scleroderma citrinum Foug A]
MLPPPEHTLLLLIADISCTTAVQTLPIPNPRTVYMDVVPTCPLVNTTRSSTDPTLRTDRTQILHGQTYGALRSRALTLRARRSGACRRLQAAPVLRVQRTLQYSALAHSQRNDCARTGTPLHR